MRQGRRAWAIVIVRAVSCSGIMRRLCARGAFPPCSIPMPRQDDAPQILPGALKPTQGTLRLEGQFAFMPKLFHVSFDYASSTWCSALA